MASSMAWMTILRSIDFSRATASAICRSSRRLALMPARPTMVSHPPRRIRCRPRTHRRDRLYFFPWRGAAPLEQALPSARAWPRQRARPANQSCAGLEALENAPEAPPAVDGLNELDFGLVAGPVLEVRRAHERPVDPRRGHLEPVAAAHDVVRVEDRRKLARDGLAIVDRDRAAGPLGHDL